MRVREDYSYQMWREVIITEKIMSHQTKGTIRTRRRRTTTATMNVSAPISLRGWSSKTFYTHRSQTSTMFVEKSVKMHSFLSTLKEEGSCHLFQIWIIHPKKNITARITIFQWDSLITIRNHFDFWNNIRQIK